MTSSAERRRVLLHARYFASCLSNKPLPEPYSKGDTNRLTLAHFAVNALDLLGVWGDSEQNSDAGDMNSERGREKELGLDRDAIVDWIYSLQVVVAGAEAGEDGNGDSWKNAGFKGGTFLGPSASASSDDEAGGCPHHHRHEYDQGHVAMTYTALCTLRTLGDDWRRVDRKAIANALRGLQLSEDGSFRSVAAGSESDMRFLYCACSISHLLNDWSGVDVDAATQYIKSCRSWDGAFALLPGQEGHGGSTFCAVASLVLMDKLDDVLDGGKEWRKDLVRWCVHRQVGGMQGRPNKDEDTCYSYWIGGTLRLLGEDALLDHDALRKFVAKCESKRTGGFSKIVGAYPDLLHSYYSLCYLSNSQRYCGGEEKEGGGGTGGGAGGGGFDELNLKELNTTLGICMERAMLFEPVHP